LISKNIIQLLSVVLNSLAAKKGKRAGARIENQDFRSDLKTTRLFTDLVKGFLFRQGE